jgi:hypothetical protein
MRHGYWVLHPGIAWSIEVVIWLILLGLLGPLAVVVILLSLPFAIMGTTRYLAWHRMLRSMQMSAPLTGSPAYGDEVNGHTLLLLGGVIQWVRL